MNDQPGRGACASRSSEVTGTSILRGILVGTLVVTALPSPTVAATLVGDTEVEGVIFAAPGPLVSQPVPAGSGPVAKLWKDPEGMISETVAVSDSDGAAVVKEMEDWPSVGRSLIDGFGSSNAKALSKVYSADCNFSGTPLLRDMSRAMMGGEVTTTCQTSPALTVLKSRMIVVATRSKQVIFRIDALPAADAPAAKIVADLWKSITVSDVVRVVPSAPSSIDVVDRTWAGSVSGGRGFHLVSYGTIRPAALIGEAVGTLLAALLFGWLFTILLMWPGIPPPYAIAISQLICIGLTAWGNEHDGSWTLSPAMWLLNALAGAALLAPARRRWKRKHPGQSPTPESVP
jgi:hypothetical protein